MTIFEIVLSITSIAVGGGVSAYMWHLGNTCGRDKHIDQERVKRFVESAPYERLDKVLSK